MKSPAFAVALIFAASAPADFAHTLQHVGHRLLRAVVMIPVRAPGFTTNKPPHRTELTWPGAIAAIRSEPGVCAVSTTNSADPDDTNCRVVAHHLRSNHDCARSVGVSDYRRPTLYTDNSYRAACWIEGNHGPETIGAFRNGRGGAKFHPGGTAAEHRSVRLYLRRSGHLRKNWGRPCCCARRGASI